MLLPVSAVANCSSQFALVVIIVVNEINIIRNSIEFERQRLHYSRTYIERKCEHCQSMWGNFIKLFAVNWILFLILTVPSSAVKPHSI